MWYRSTSAIYIHYIYSWFDYIWSKILGLLLALQVGLFVWRMREMDWQLLIKLFSMAVGSIRLILISLTINTSPDKEVDDKISFNITVLGNFWFVSWSVNTNNNCGTAYCLSCLSVWCQFISDDLWNAVVCFQPPTLLIGKVWVSVMHFCTCLIHCKVHWRMGRRLGSCRLILRSRWEGQQSGNSQYKLCSVSIGGSGLSILTQFIK